MDLYKLLAYLEESLIPAMRAYDYRPAVSPVDLILGLSGCHSNFLPVLRTVAQEERVSLLRLITKVSAIDRKNPSVELIRQTAKKLATE